MLPMDQRLPNESMSAYKVRLVAAHVRHELSVHRQRHGAGRHIPPLIVGMQGPQGSGKTTLTSQLVRSLAEGTSRDEPKQQQSKGASNHHNDEAELATRSLNVAVFSIDDLYLPFVGLERVAQDHPENKLLQGRGQPGTHDIELGSKILSQLSRINDVRGNSSCSGASTEAVELPIFDKSLHGGRGDRSGSTVKIHAPLDVVLFEGWCLGFRELADAELADRYHHATGEQPPQSLASQQAHKQPYFVRHKLDDLMVVNKHLGGMVASWYPHIHAFVQLVPTGPPGSATSHETCLDTVFDWRLQAEHAMKAENGGRGMSDEEVHSFVERYMPGYELFGEGVTASDALWRGRVLRVGLDEQRDVTLVERC